MLISDSSLPKTEQMLFNDRKHLLPACENSTNTGGQATAAATL